MPTYPKTPSSGVIKSSTPRSPSSGSVGTVTPRTPFDGVGERTFPWTRGRRSSATAIFFESIREKEMLTFLIAASDASDESRASADHVCSGVNDEVEIETAIAALPASGGTVWLSEGTFYIDAQLDVDSPVVIRGLGKHMTTLRIGTGLVWGVDIGSSKIKFADLRLYSVDGDNGDYASGTHLVGMTDTGLSEIEFEDCIFEHARIGIKWWANTHISVKHCIFKDLAGKALCTGGGGTGIAEYISVEDCEFYAGGGGNAVCMDPARHFTIANIRLIGDGVSSGNRVDLTSQNFTVEDGTITNVVAEAQGGIESPTPVAANAPTNITISNLAVKDAFDYPAIQGYFGQVVIQGVCFDSDDWYGINIQQATELTLAGVIIDCASLAGMAPNTPTVNIASVNRAKISNLKVIGSGVATGPCLYFNGADVSVANSEFRASAGIGVTAAGDRASFQNCLFEGNAYYGLRFNNGDGKVIGCTFKDNSNGNNGVYSDISVPGVNGPIVKGCRFEGTDIDYHFEESSAVGDPSLVEGNFFDGTPTVSAVRVQKAGTRIHDNIGWITENSGTATITNPATSVTVNHGLSVTPAVDDITVTLAEMPTADVGTIWVSTVGVAQFTINCRNAPGVSDLDLAWRAVVL